MNVFVDTSAFLAVLDADDKDHAKAKTAWTDLISSEANLLCHNYVLVESSALIKHRLGLKAVRVFEGDILPLIHVKWIAEDVHKAGVSALLTASKRKLSLVDCVSFEIMRRLGLDTAFTFDSHFDEQGFVCIPKVRAKDSV